VSSAADFLSINAPDKDCDDQASNASFGTCEYNCIDAPIEVPLGAHDSTDPLQWNSFVVKMAKTLNIVPEKDSEVENLRKSFISSRLQNDKSDRNKSLIKMPL
jgi:hypothetical protein